jgi:hypothetical protein
VKEVWTHGYGSGDDLTWLFLALARASGIEAYPILVAARDTRVFKPDMMNPGDLNTNTVMAILDGKELYLDPGVRFAPYGVLSWDETGVSGFRPEKGGGTWFHIPLADAKDSRVERKGVFRLTSSGTLEGRVTVNYTGQEALWLRQVERNEDDAERKQFIEDQLKADVPSGIEVELTNRPAWDDSSLALTAEYDVRIPGWAAGAGQRRLLPVGLFGAKFKQVFQHAIRIHPIYFKFLYQQSDDVTIELAPDWKAASVPENRSRNLSVFAYERSSETVNGSLHLNRQFSLNTLLIATKYYETVEGFFEFVRAGEEDQAVLIPAAGVAKH